MRTRRLIQLITVALAAVLIVSAANAQPQVDYSRMERDLNIMENILETILSDPGVKDYFQARRIKGAYLDNYGAVFMMSASTRNYRDEQAQAAKQGFELMQTLLHGFLLDYAGSIKQLRDSDRIALVVNTTENNIWRWSLEFSGREAREEVFEPYPFIMTVLKSEINRARTGNIPVERFAGRVNFTPVGTAQAGAIPRAMDQSITIMKGIIETAIETKIAADLDRDRFMGAYLDDYGVLFIINSGDEVRIGVPSVEDFITVRPRAEVTVVTPERLQELIKVRVSELEKQIETAFEVKIKKLEQEEEERQVQRQKEYKERINNLINVLTEVIGDYGHTIRNLQPAEEVAVLYTSTNSYWGDERGQFNLMLTATYRDILDYSRGSIPLEEFKNRVRASTYE